MDFNNRSFNDGDSLLQGDWRTPGTGGAAKIAPKPRLGPAALHLGAKRASAAQERNRARELVSFAKEQMVSTFEDVRFGRNINPAALWPLVSSITASVERHPGAVMGVTRIRDRHEHTYLHSVAVCGLMIGLARKMGLDPTLHHDIGLAGLLHDIGKARVPTTLLDKDGPLTSDEMAVVRTHAETGHEILTSSGDRLPDIVLDVCLHHHERLDGTGYPDHKDQSGLSVYARMAAVCDVYDAVTSTRSYKPTWSPAEAIEWMASEPGQFDPQIVSVFSGMIGIFPAGSMVRLASDRLAVVLDDPEGDPMKPSVCPFYCIVTKQPLPWRVSPPGMDPITSIEVPARWKLTNWAELRRSIMSHDFSGAAQG